MVPLSTSTHYLSNVYVTRFVYALLFLVAVQTSFVLLPSGMCSIVEAVPPSGARINFITPQDGSAKINYNIGDSGGSTVTSVEYSTDNGETWGILATNPNQVGEATIFTDSDGTPLENDNKIVVIIRTSTKAFPDVVDNTASESTEVTATPSETPPEPQPPRIISYYNVTENQFGITFVLNSPGNTQFSNVYYSTDNGATWANTGLTGPGFGSNNDDLNDVNNFFLLTSTSADTNVNLSYEETYLVKFAVTTVADGVTKLSSNMVPMYTSALALPGESPPDVNPSTPDTTTQPTEDPNCIKFFYELPSFAGNDELDSFWVSTDDGNPGTYVKVSDIIAAGIVEICGLATNVPVTIKGVWTNKANPDPNVIPSEDLNAAVDEEVPIDLPEEPVKADAPNIVSITPSNTALLVECSFPSRGTGLFKTLYYRLDTGSWNEATLTNFSGETSSFFIEGLTNATTYAVTLRVTTTDFENVDHALTSDPVNGTPAASTSRPSKPSITDVVETQNFDNMISQYVVNFIFNIKLGINGGSDFTNVFYTTDGGGNFLPLNVSSDVRVTIDKQSNGDAFVEGETYPVQIVSSTADYDYDDAPGNTLSDVFNMSYTGTSSAPDAPVLHDVTVNQFGSVLLYFTLLGYNDTGVNLYYTTNFGTGDNYISISTLSPAIVTEDSLGNAFSSGAYNFKLSLTNSAVPNAQDGTKSGNVSLTYPVLLSRGKRELTGYGSAFIETATLGDEICLHEDWKKYQTWFNSISFGLALGIPSVVLWKVKVVPWYPIGLAFFFWIFSHALRDFRDKSVTTEYKFAARWLLYTEKLFKWLSFGFLISAPLSVYSYNAYGKRELFDMYLENKNYKNNSKTVGVFH